jgi:hypothetical protein
VWQMTPAQIARELADQATAQMQAAAFADPAPARPGPEPEAAPVAAAEDPAATPPSGGE